jgi:hypothetical protein
MGFVIGPERVRVDLEQGPVEQERGLRAPQDRDRTVDRDARRDERVQERVRVPRALAVTILDPRGATPATASSLTEPARTRR